MVFNKKINSFFKQKLLYNDETNVLNKLKQSMSVSLSFENLKKSNENTVSLKDEYFTALSILEKYYFYKQKCSERKQVLVIFSNNILEYRQIRVWTQFVYKAKRDGRRNG